MLAPGACKRAPRRPKAHNPRWPQDGGRGPGAQSGHLNGHFEPPTPGGPNTPRQAPQEALERP
eukprot:2574351-Pyramimonas_sp.AAC.1